ncbi:carboxypeptidase-like regulatory domain-containing protein [Nannocystis sp.]|uniref:carboxypeptidase-like regulatory domain-containing protein n=1 Tax=Nannocystis sp. TaxID=1962667 RepID=UPI0025E47D89|nr:carboxypeptidase-like regulatory domain-containing protein [Nannocystis sp.]MBK7824404.1 carboxypeptidase regulatory-like domain-containing protein [Nannocystis sp.]
MGRARWAVIGLLLAGLGGVLAWLWLGAPPPVIEGGSEASEGGEAGAPAVVLAPPRRVLGRVLLESLAVGTGPEGQVEKDSLDAGPLTPPPLGQCTARAWRAEKLLAEASCAADGSFALALAVTEAVVVEMLVPGRLRAVLTTPATDADVQLPTVALGLASSLRGEVIDGQGRAVAGAEVAALPLPNLGEPEPWRVTSAADGSFLLDTLPEGPIRLRTSKPGHALTIRDAYAPEAGVVIVLDELLGLTGAVIGEPKIAARARVRLEGSSLWPPVYQRVAADGSFAFTELVDGVYGLVATVEAEAPGDQEYASIPLENLGAGTEVGLALALAYRIPVRVISPDGAPVAGARVTVGYASVGLLQQVGETGPEGQVAIGPIVPGPYVVSADADGYLPSEAIQVDLGATPLPTQTLTLLRPGRIAGIVVDERGQPVVAASVVVDSEQLYSVGEGSARAGTFTALLRGGSLGVTGGTVPPIPLTALAGGLADAGEVTGLMAESDEAGRFALELLLPGTYRLRAVHGLHAASPVAVVTLAPGQAREGVVLTLGRGVHVTGRVFDGNRRPLAGVRVELGDGSEVLTDAFGVFDAGYRRGRERLVLRRAGLIPEVVELDLGREDVVIERLMQPAEGELTGRIRGGNDQPLAGVRVTLTPKDGLTATQVGWTDERGLFEFTDLAPGTGALEFDHPDYAPGQRSVKVARTRGGAPVEVSLVAGWSLALSVRARGSGDPIAGARVEVDERLWSTDEAGEAEVRRLAGERVRVVVRAGGWVAQSELIERPASGAATLVFELDEAAGMEGEITDERGEPVGGARVLVRSADGSTLLAEAKTTADGRWSVPDLPEGDVRVEAIPPPALAEILAPVAMDSDVRRGHVTREVDLRFDRL